MKIGKLFAYAVRVVKANPEIALMVVGAVAPKLAKHAIKAAAVVKAAR